MLMKIAAFIVAVILILSLFREKSNLMDKKLFVNPAGSCMVNSGVKEVSVTDSNGKTVWFSAGGGSYSIYEDGTLIWTIVDCKDWIELH